MDTSFVVMSDTHFAIRATGQDECWWNRMLVSQSPAIAESIVSTVRALAPDFVIHCGDFTNSSDVESFHFGKEIMDRLGCPYYIVLGNHDTWNEGSHKAATDLFNYSGEGKFYYVQQLAGLRFIFLDYGYWIKKDGTESEHLDFELYRQGVYAGSGPSMEELKWFERELARDSGQPTAIVFHCPLHARESYVVGTLPGDGSGCPSEEDPTKWHAAIERHFDHENGRITKKYCVHGNTLRQLISGAPNIKAVFSGHWHISDITTEQGVLHCKTCSLVEYPFEMRLVRIHGKKLSITTVGLDNQRFAKDSLVPERNNQWVAGKDGDREHTLVIP